MAAALSEETERRAAEEKLTDGERRLEAEMAK